MATRPHGNAALPEPRTTALPLATSCAAHKASAEPLALDDVHFPALATAAAAKVRPWQAHIACVVKLLCPSTCSRNLCFGHLQPAPRRKIQPTRVAAVAVDQRFAAVQLSSKDSGQSFGAAPSHGTNAAAIGPSPAQPCTLAPSGTIHAATAASSTDPGPAASLERLLSGGARLNSAPTHRAVAEGSGSVSRLEAVQLPATQHLQRAPACGLPRTSAGSPSVATPGAAMEASTHATAHISSGNGCATHDCQAAIHLQPRGGAAEDVGRTGGLSPRANRLAQLHAALIGCSTAVVLSAELAVLVHLLALQDGGNSGSSKDTAPHNGGTQLLIDAGSAAQYACAVLQASGVCL